MDVDTTFAAADVEIDDGGDLNGEDNAVVISARIPDMKDPVTHTGYPQIGQILVMVVSDGLLTSRIPAKMVTTITDSPLSEAAQMTGPMQPRKRISALIPVLLIMPTTLENC